MPTFKDIKSLLAHAQKASNTVLKTDVAKDTVKTMQQKIQEEVYDKYDPLMYQRKSYQGGLIDQDNIEVSMVDDNTLCVENIRFEDNREVAEIVESGVGYQYGFIEERMRNGWAGGERPFTDETRKELKNGKLHKAMKNGLRKRGFDVE